MSKFDSTFRSLWISDSDTSGSTALTKLKEFSLPPETLARVYPCALLGSFMGLDSDAFLGEDGDLAIAFYKNDMCVEVLFDQDETTSVVVEAGVGFEFEELDDISPATFDDIQEQIQKLAAYINNNSRAKVWNSSVFSNLIGGTNTGADSLTSPLSGHHQVQNQGRPPILQTDTLGYQYST